MPTNTIPFSVITSILLESFSLVGFLFSLSDDRVCIRRAREVSEQFDEPENNVNCTPLPAQQQDLTVLTAFRYPSSHLLV